MKPAATTIIRDATVRRNISYNIRCAEADGELSYANPVLRSFVTAKETRDHLKTPNCLVIVSCKSSDNCNTLQIVCSTLSQKMSKVFDYHAGMPDRDRSESVEKWSSTSPVKSSGRQQQQQKPFFECRVMICTSAFRFGIDVNNILLVVHVDSPCSILSFAQKSGRCG